MNQSTPRQRLYARILFRDLDLPTDYITKMNFAVFDAAGLPRPTEGTRVDSALESITVDQCKKLITALEGEKRKVS